MRTTYKKHSSETKVKFQLNLLSKEDKSQIAYSTLNDWKDIDHIHIYGYDKFKENSAIYVGHLEHQNQQLKARCKSLLSMLVMLIKMLHQQGLLYDLLKQNSSAFVKTIEYTRKCIPYKKILDKFYITSNQYKCWKSSHPCSISLMNLCRITRPHQLLVTEVNTIRRYLNNAKYQYWYLISIYYQMLNDGVIYIGRSAFYKYVKLLKHKRKKRAKERKSNPGITSSRIFEKLHMDITCLRLEDYTKVYIYLIIDNFSRAVLGCKVSIFNHAQIAADNIKEVVQKYGLASQQVELYTDGGSENKGSVAEWLKKNENNFTRIFTHQHKAITNNLIESFNKRIKEIFLYRHSFISLAVLEKFIFGELIPSYMSMPLGALFGSTPTQVLKGKIPDKNEFKSRIAATKKIRVAENKRICCIRN